MSVLYIIAGVNHFIHPHFYLKIMPPWLPLHSLLVLLSGIMEAVFGILLFIPATRVFAAWGLIALLIAVFPANVQMNYRQQHNPHLWLTVLRLPLQVLLIAWAYVYTK
jgi:uncharacterized membrane protein